MRSSLVYAILAVLLLCQLTNGLQDVESTRAEAVEAEPVQQVEELLLIDNSPGQQANEGPRVARQFGGFGGPGFGPGYGGGFGPGYGGGFGGGGFGGGGFGGGYGGGFQRVRTVTRTRVVNRFRGGGFGGGYGGGFYG